jgi:hypothetical protein
LAVLPKLARLIKLDLHACNALVTKQLVRAVPVLEQSLDLEPASGK